jgi:glycosyltransferase involved in cell wall biosynthesis
LKKVLYISYDGLTDPLGQSQILPYLEGLSKYGYEFSVLSFEKKDRFKKQAEHIKGLTACSGIKWFPLSFTKNPPLISKFYDAVRMRSWAFALHKKYKFDLVHCRSYISADIGLQLKKKFGVKFLFDMRGFWPDEKKDGGSWNTANPFYKKVYNYYKNKEAEYLQNADYIITLTEAGKKEMMQWPYYNQYVPLRVIPCCADMDVFSLTNSKEKKLSREKLNLREDQLVLSYLGSVGTWYMLHEMLAFFKQVKKHYSDAKFLFVTTTARSVIEEEISKLKLNEKDFIILSAFRHEVPFLIKASDINISFIKPVYSKISSSPTKLGEVLAMGIPVICNSGVGDVEEIVQLADGGYVLNNFSESDFDKAIQYIPYLLKTNPERIRNAIKDIYSLSKGVESYADCYRMILS